MQAFAIAIMQCEASIIQCGIVVVESNNGGAQIRRMLPGFSSWCSEMSWTPVASNIRTVIFSKRLSMRKSVWRSRTCWAR
ncbi:unnamed protein product [Periconia digitata]|uniref:Uncharacterized protein n=1 Tax=Periconia digitata TaxID=1303443 RepID=A0A9W4U605_9PLEO|nr:unnamed protein product [Periconia digitata]